MLPRVRAYGQLILRPWHNFRLYGRASRVGMQERYTFAEWGAPIPGLICVGPLADGRTSKSKIDVGM